MFEIKVLGSGCSKCQQTKELIEKVASDNAVPITIEKIEDTAEIMKHGIMTTPGVIVNDKVAHLGSVPDTKTILNWFKTSCCPTDEGCC